jgi:hypothetical protein
MNRADKKIRPTYHQLAPFLQKISTPVSELGCITDRMRESLLANLTREIRLLGTPISK